MSCCSRGFHASHPTAWHVWWSGKTLAPDTLQRWLIEQVYGYKRVASAKGFRVLLVRGQEEPRSSHDAPPSVPTPASSGDAPPSR